MNSIRLIILGSALVIAMVSSTSFAQEEDSKKDYIGQNVGYEAGFHVGKLLPNRIEGVTEILGVGGVRAGMRIGQATFAEAGFTTGNGAGSEWKNISTSVRMDMPVENIVATAFIGLDATNFKGTNLGSRMIFGGHVGGGLLSSLGGLTWFRANMSFGLSPGTSLFIDAGFVFRFGGGDSSSGSGS